LIRSAPQDQTLAKTKTVVHPLVRPLHTNLALSCWHLKHCDIDKPQGVSTAITALRDIARAVGGAIFDLKLLASNPAHEPHWRLVKQNRATVVSRIVASERERCAKIAENVGNANGHCDCCCESIAAAIRAGEF
jgi:hypothetical protein